LPNAREGSRDRSEAQQRLQQEHEAAVAWGVPPPMPVRGAVTSGSLVVMRTRDTDRQISHKNAELNKSEFEATYFVPRLRVARSPAVRLSNEVPAHKGSRNVRRSAEGGTARRHAFHAMRGDVGRRTGSFLSTGTAASGATKGRSIDHDPPEQSRSIFSSLRLPKGTFCHALVMVSRQQRQRAAAAHAAHGAACAAW
jgi:hypothetical protein